MVSITDDFTWAILPQAVRLVRLPYVALNSVEFDLSPYICRLSGSSIVCGCDDGVVRIYEIPRAILTDHKLTLKVKHVLGGGSLYSEVPWFSFGGGSVQ